MPFNTIAELAEREGIAPSYMTRVLRLTLFAPEIVETILDGKQGPEVTLAQLLEPFPAEWARQQDVVKRTQCGGLPVSTETLLTTPLGSMEQMKAT